MPAPIEYAASPILTRDPDPECPLQWLSGTERFICEIPAKYDTTTPDTKAIQIILEKHVNLIEVEAHWFTFLKTPPGFDSWSTKRWFRINDRPIILITLMREFLESAADAGLDQGYIRIELIS